MPVHTRLPHEYRRIVANAKEAKRGRKSRLWMGSVKGGDQSGELRAATSHNIIDANNFIKNIFDSLLFLCFEEGYHIVELITLIDLGQLTRTREPQNTMQKHKIPSRRGSLQSHKCVQARCCFSLRSSYARISMNPFNSVKDNDLHNLACSAMRAFDPQTPSLSREEKTTRVV